MDSNQNQKKEEKLRVGSVTIDRNDVRIKGAKSLKDLQKLYIFSHIQNKDERAVAEKDLQNQLGLPDTAASDTEDGGSSDGQAVDNAARIKELSAKNPEDLTEAEASELDTLESLNKG